MLGMQNLLCVAAFLIAGTKAHEVVAPNGISVVDDNANVAATDVESSKTKLAGAGVIKKHVREGTSTTIEQELTESNPCDGSPHSIPFMITDFAGTHDGDQLILYDSSTGLPEDVYFLKDVVYCPETSDSPYTVSGTKVTVEEFKAGVQQHLDENSLDSVFYVMHGVNTPPGGSTGSFVIGEYWAQMFQDATRMLGIPITWYSCHDMILPVGYETSRNSMAIRAAKLFAHNAEVFRADYTASIMTHSQGNWVYRVMAQELAEMGNSEPFFENHYMSAADARSDMFADAFNPDAPSSKNHIKVAADVRSDSDEKKRQQQSGVSLEDDFSTDGMVDVSECAYDGGPLISIGLPVPAEECRLNGGYDITKLANHVHVIWNADDLALLSRELFQTGAMTEFRQALGRHGDHAESYMNLKYFKDRVTFHDLTDRVLSHMLSHAYFFEYPSTLVYDPLLTEDCHMMEDETSQCEYPYVNQMLTLKCCRYGHLNAPFSLPSVPVMIKNPDLNLSIGLETSSCNNGNLLTLQGNEAETNRLFRLGNDGEIWSELCPGKLLHIPDWFSCRDDRKVELWDDRGSENQRWDIGQSGDIRNRECISYVMSVRAPASGLSRGHGSEICIYEGTSELPQRWELITVSAHPEVPEDYTGPDPPPEPTYPSI